MKSWERDTSVIGAVGAVLAMGATVFGMVGVATSSDIAGDKKRVVLLLASVWLVICLAVLLDMARRLRK